MRLFDMDSKEDYLLDGKYKVATPYGPCVDAVEIVRCKDCRHAGECHKSVQYTRNEPNTVTIGYSPIEWCSHGERREEVEADTMEYEPFNKGGDDE